MDTIEIHMSVVLFNTFNDIYTFCTEIQIMSFKTALYGIFYETVGLFSVGQSVKHGTYVETLLFIKIY